MEQDEDADDVDDDADTTDDPMDMPVSCPCKDEKTNGDEETAEQGWDQAAFGTSQAVSENLGLDNVVEVSVVCCYRDDDADSDGEEHQSHLSDVETVAIDVD